MCEHCLWPGSHWQQHKLFHWRPEVRGSTELPTDAAVPHWHCRRGSRPCHDHSHHLRRLSPQVTREQSGHEAHEESDGRPGGKSCQGMQGG